MRPSEKKPLCLSCTLLVHRFTYKKNEYTHACIIVTTYNLFVHYHDPQNNKPLFFSRFQGVIDVHFNSNFKLHTFTRTYINRHPWMTEALRTQIRLKNSKYMEYVKSNNIDIVESYKDSKRILHSSLRNAEIQYYSEQYELNSSDMFKSWKVLKTILALNRNYEKRKLCLTINNVAVTNSQDIAIGFNNCFVSIGPELAKGIHSVINPLTYVKNIKNSIAIFDVSCEEVRHIIDSLYIEFIKINKHKKKLQIYIQQLMAAHIIVDNGYLKIE